MGRLGVRGSPRMSFGTSFEGALSGCNWTISLHTIFGAMPHAALAANLRKTLPCQWRGIGTDSVPSRPCFRVDNRAISGLQAESGGACKRPLRLPLRSDIRRFTVKPEVVSREQTVCVG